MDNLKISGFRRIRTRDSQNDYLIYILTAFHVPKSHCIGVRNIPGHKIIDYNINCYTFILLFLLKRFFIY